MTHSKLKGVIAAIATPVTAEGAPDTDRFLKLADFLLANGCDGLNVLGTTGEATSFTVDQRLSVMNAIKRSGLPLDRMMVGTGAAAVDDAVRLTASAAQLGFGAALLLPPFYYKEVTDDGILDYFGAIVPASGKLALLLYNFPAQSGIKYHPALVRSLVSRFGYRIAGLKDSSGDLEYSRIVAKENPGFKVFPSSEGVLLEARSGVFAGCISATANLNASYCQKAFAEGDEAAYEIAVAIRNLFTGKPLVPGIKALLAHIHSDPALARTKPPLSVYGGEGAADLAAQYKAIVA